MDPLSSPGSFLLCVKCKRPRSSQVCPHCQHDHRQPLKWRPDDVVNGYRLKALIGEGSMGEVWRVSQEDDHEVEHALKFTIALEGGTFLERERSLLLSINHTNVARVHRTGRATLGRSFYVMDLVECGLDKDGKEATDPKQRHPNLLGFCTDHRKTARERVELMIKVCDAVEHLHKHGIVHRDLKLGNVLVSHNGSLTEPKIIDFGLAKRMGVTDKGETAANWEIPAGGGTLMSKEFGHYRGTPAFSSPEQLRDATLVGPQADVYSLGVMLCQLLTGSLPCWWPDEAKLLADLEKQGLFTEDLREKLQRPRPSIRQVISQMSPHARRRQVESLAGSAQPLAKLVTWDLRSIIERALLGDLTKRYANAGELTEDLRRCLARQPVEARRSWPWPWWGKATWQCYAGGRFFERHRVACIATFVALLAMTIGIWKTSEANAALADTNIRLQTKTEEATNNAKAANKARDVAQAKTMEAQKAQEDEKKASKRAKEQALDTAKARDQAQAKTKEALDAQQKAKDAEANANKSAAEASANAARASEQLSESWRLRIEAAILDRNRRIEDLRRILQFEAPGSLSWWVKHSEDPSLKPFVVSAVKANLLHTNMALLIARLEHPSPVESICQSAGHVFVGCSSDGRDSPCCSYLWLPNEWRLALHSPIHFGDRRARVGFRPPRELLFFHQTPLYPEQADRFVLPRKGDNLFVLPLLSSGEADLAHFRNDRLLTVKEAGEGASKGSHDQTGIDKLVIATRHPHVTAEGMSVTVTNYLWDPPYRWDWIKNGGLISSSVFKSDQPDVKKNIPGDIIDLSTDGLGLILEGEFVRLVRIDSPEQDWLVIRHQMRVTTGCFLPGGRLAVGNEFGEVHVWQLLHQTPLSDAHYAPKRNCPDLDTATKQQFPNVMIQCYLPDPGVTLWSYNDLGRHYLLQVSPHEKAVLDTGADLGVTDGEIACLSSDGKWMASYYMPGHGSHTDRAVISFFDISAREWLPNSCQLKSSAFADDQCMTFSSDGKTFIAAAGNQVLIWRGAFNQNPETIPLYGAEQVAAYCNVSVLAIGCLEATGSLGFIRSDNQIIKARLPNLTGTKWSTGCFDANGSVFACITGGKLYAVSTAGGQVLMPPRALNLPSGYEASESELDNDGVLHLRCSLSPAVCRDEDYYSFIGPPRPKDDLQMDIPLLASAADMKRASGIAEAAPLIVQAMQPVVTSLPPMPNGLPDWVAPTANALRDRSFTGSADAMFATQLKMLPVTRYGLASSLLKNEKIPMHQRPVLQAYLDSIALQPAPESAPHYSLARNALFLAALGDTKRAQVALGNSAKYVEHFKADEGIVQRAEHAIAEAGVLNLTGTAEERAVRAQRMIDFIGRCPHEELHRTLHDSCELLPDSLLEAAHKAFPQMFEKRDNN